MNKYVSRGLWLALFVGGLSVGGACAANAAETDGTDAIASGTQSGLSISVPVTLVGDAISVLGDAVTDAAAPAPAPAEAPAPAAPEASPEAVPPALSTSGSDGVASGTQAPISIEVPVTITDTAVSVLGDAESSHEAEAPAATEPAARLRRLAGTSPPRERTASHPERRRPSR